jgi:hypothetical protein
VVQCLLDAPLERGVNPISMLGFAALPLAVKIVLATDTRFSSPSVSYYAESGNWSMEALYEVVWCRLRAAVAAQICTWSSDT